jgi:hypothetical protein
MNLPETPVFQALHCCLEIIIRQNYFRVGDKNEAAGAAVAAVVAEG